MNTDPNETVQFDGGAPTEEEAKLIAEGVGDGNETATATATVDDGAAARAVAEAAEATRLASAAAAAAAAEAAAEAAAPVATIELPAKPDAPKDFAAEVKAIEDAYEAGDITAVELNRKTRELTLEEAAYNTAVANWQVAHDAAIAAQKASVANGWDTAAAAFEKEHADFMSNPLRVKYMQESIALVDQQNATAGKTMTDAEVLAAAYKIAAEFTGYQAPTPVDARAKTGEALAGRKQEIPGKTLGDVPQSAIETVRGDANFAALDGLSTPELEIAFANMTPSQQEAYLRDAPGATANGRDSE